MPRIRIEMPVSILALPVCVRCLDIEPGVPGAALDYLHPGPFTKDMCVACCLAVAKELHKERGPFARSTSRITEELASHAIVIRPMQPWPRQGMPDQPDGPSRLALGPLDYEGQGREAFWDQTPQERAAALSAMVADANTNCATKVDVRYLGTMSERKQFAKGWLNELDRVRKK